MRGARPNRALEALVAREAALEAGETVLVAVSGGPDSVALAGLIATAAEAAGATVVLAHVNHALRSSAWQDEAVVLALGAALRRRVVATSLPAGPADEARLRAERYGALARLARGVGAARLFVGHQARDQAETVLLALFRGTGPQGLAGMPAERELGPGLRVVRPVLGVEPEALRAYVRSRVLPCVLDPSNDDLAYRRNAMRAALEPLRAVFPHLDAAVARCARLVAEERAEAPRAHLRRQLRAELSRAAGSTRDVSFERLDAAAAALERRRPGRHFLRRGVELVVSDGAASGAEGAAGGVEGLAE